MTKDNDKKLSQSEKRTVSGKLKQRHQDNVEARYQIALAGNPNTGKSTVFNALTGLKQHTGNWPGKTVGRAEGAFDYNGATYSIVDLPGTYSLLSTSEDEEIARDHILFGKPDVTVIVADAMRLERNLNLVLQILEITNKVVLCVNLMDEAKRNGIKVDLEKLSKILGVPVVGTSARSGKGISELLKTIEQIATQSVACIPHSIGGLPAEAERVVSALTQSIMEKNPGVPNSRWIAFRMIEGDKAVLKQYAADEELKEEAKKAAQSIGDGFHDRLSEFIYADVAKICAQIIRAEDGKKSSVSMDQRIDRIVTSKKWGFPIMVFLLGIVLWLTIIGSNYPSAWLSDILVGTIHPWLKTGALSAGMNSWIAGLLIDGVYLSTAWVVSVMLPPMAIFFPLFTLLEDFGYLHVLPLIWTNYSDVRAPMANKP